MKNKRKQKERNHYLGDEVEIWSKGMVMVRKVTCRHLGVILEKSNTEELQVKRVLVVLEDVEIFTSGGLVKDKVLFCSTENGRSSFVRQLEPDWHIDSNPEIISQLARFIKYQLHVSPFRTERTAANIFSAPSLE
ncbi:hypothetical protein JHK87_033264 [Glycine soja]|nr:hypothetical protein JHK87_033264 [Glycine soja]